MLRTSRKNERGFTLVELLIVVAILGVLAAVVIPNLSNFIGAGESEAKATELSNVQAAVSLMMVDRDLKKLPTPVTSSTSNMSSFPDTAYPLYGANVSGTITNYLVNGTTAYYYDVDDKGTVTQHTSAGQ